MPACTAPDATSTRALRAQRRRARIPGPPARPTRSPGGADVYTLYSANYLNWYNAPDSPTEITRLDVVKAVGASLAYSIDNLNLGLMRFSTGAKTDDFSEGGMVMHEIANLATSRESIVNRLYDFTPDGFTPLSETLYEAGQYLAGRAVDYGVASTVEFAVPFPSVPDSRQRRRPVALPVAGAVPVPTQLRRAAHRWRAHFGLDRRRQDRWRCRTSPASGAAVAMAKATAAASTTWPNT